MQCSSQDNLLTEYQDTDALLNEFERSSPVQRPHYGHQQDQGGYQRAPNEPLSPLSSIGSEPLFGAQEKHGGEGNEANELLIDLEDDFPEATPSNADFLSQLNSHLSSPRESNPKQTPSAQSIDKQLQEVGNEAYALVDSVTELSSLVDDESSTVSARLKRSLEKMMAAANNVLSGICSANEDFAQFASALPSEPRAQSVNFRSNPLSDPFEEKEKAMKTIDGEAQISSLKKKIEALASELANRQRLEAKEKQRTAELEAKEKQRTAELEARISAISEEHAESLTKLQSAADACRMLRSSLDRAADAAVVLATSSTPGEQQENEEALAIAIESSLRLVDGQAETLVLPKALRDTKVSNQTYIHHPYIAFHGQYVFSFFSGYSLWTVNIFMEQSLYLSIL